MLSSGARSGGPAPPLADHPHTYTPHDGRSGNEGSVATNTTATGGNWTGGWPRLRRRAPALLSKIRRNGS